MLTCTTTRMIEGVVVPEPAYIQDKITLIFECSRVGRTHGLLVRRAAVLANTTGIKCGERFADGVVITCDVDARVEIFGKEMRIELSLQECVSVRLVNPFSPWCGLNCRCMTPTIEPSFPYKWKLLSNSFEFKSIVCYI